MYEARIVATAEPVQFDGKSGHGPSVGPGRAAEIVTLYALGPIVATTVLLPQHGAQHLVDKVVDVKKLECSHGVLDG